MAAPHRPRPRKSPKSPAGAQSSRRRGWHPGRHAGRGRSSEAGDVAHGGPKSSTIAALRGVSSLLSLLSHVSGCGTETNLGSRPQDMKRSSRACVRTSEERDESGRDGGLVAARANVSGLFHLKIVHSGARYTSSAARGNHGAERSAELDPRPDGTFATNRNPRREPRGEPRGHNPGRRFRIRSQIGAPNHGFVTPGRARARLGCNETRIRHTGQSAGSGSGGSKCAHQNSSPPSFLQPRRMVSASSHPLSSLRHGW